MTGPLAAVLFLVCASFAGQQESPIETRRASLLSRRFRLPEAEVEDLRRRGLEWREVEHALAISERTGRPVSELLKRRQDGIPWGAIAVENGLRLEDLRKDEPRR